MEEKILKYLSMCWDQYRCADKEELKKIVQETIKEHPEETNYTRLGMYAKRKCQQLI